MYQSHKIRMYPTVKQCIQLRKTVGASRYAYNWALAKWKSMYEAYTKGESEDRPSAFKLSTIWTKEKPEWAKETSRCPQQKAILNVGIAFQNAWRGLGKQPQFHKKGCKDSFYVDTSKAYLTGNRIHLPQIGKVRLAEELRFNGKIESYTVSTYAGQWFVGVRVNTPDALRGCDNAPSTVVGIDVGLSNVAVASDGTVLKAPESLKGLEVKLKDRQRALARSQRNSKNHQKLLIKKQKVQSRINNIRKDAVHKFTTTIAKNHGIVVTEDLNIKGMLENTRHRSMRRSLSHSMMSEVIRQISYKARTHVKVDRFYPSSKRCSFCGHVKDELVLNERIYKCEACGLEIDRDYNASQNLKQAGTVSPEAPVETLASQSQ